MPIFKIRNRDYMGSGLVALAVLISIVRFVLDDQIDGETPGFNLALHFLDMLVLIALAVFYVNSRKSQKYASEISDEALHLIGKVATSATDGILVRDSKYRVILANQSFLAFIGGSIDNVLGRKGLECVPDALKDVFDTEPPTEYITLQHFDVPDWREGANPGARVWVFRNFLYDARGRFEGLVTILRGVPFIEAPLSVERVSFNPDLFEGFPLPLAVCERVKNDINADFKIISHNPAAADMFEGVRIPKKRTVQQAWQGIDVQHAGLFDAVSELVAEPTARYTAWVAQIGRTLTFYLIRMSPSTFMVCLMDLTDKVAYENEVFRLQAMGSNKDKSVEANLRGQLADADNFVHLFVSAMQDIVDAQESLLISQESIWRAAHFNASENIDELRKTMQVATQHYNAAAIPARHDLMQTRALVLTLVDQYHKQYPSILFRQGALPQITACEPLLESVLRCGLDILAYLARDNNSAMIEIGVRSDFLDTSFHLEAIGMKEPILGIDEDITSLMEEGYPGLKLAVARRLMFYHGGTISIEFQKRDAITIKVKLAPAPER